MDEFTSDTKVGDRDDVNYFVSVNDLTFIHKVKEQSLNINFERKFFHDPHIAGPAKLFSSNQKDGFQLILLWENLNFKTSFHY